MSDADALFQSVRGLAEGIHSLHRQAVTQYSLCVEEIIRNRSRDVSHIEHTLDGLLDFCGYAPALQLYRRLCRYYFGIDPAATADYISAYRELWESMPETKVDSQP